jgi:dihydrofolate reductase
MTLSFIVAAADNQAIGRNNRLPWHLPNDLKFFKKTTLGKPVLMGRKTFESLGRPLPARLNIVLSRSPQPLLPEGVLCYSHIEAALQRAAMEKTDEAFIIGGAHLFESCMPWAQRLYLTRVHTSIENADVFFPKINPEEWKKVWEEAHSTDEKHAYAYTFQRWERIKN